MRHAFSQIFDNPVNRRFSVDVHGVWYSDWLSFVKDPTHAPDKTRIELMRDFQLDQFVVLDEDLVPNSHHHLLAHEAALLYHMRSLDLVMRCSGNSESRVHTRAVVSFNDCVDGMRALSGSDVRGVSRFLLCLIKSKYMGILSALYLSHFREDEIYGHGLLAVTNSFWLPRPEARGEAAVSVVDILTQDLEWLGNHPEEDLGGCVTEYAALRVISTSIQVPQCSSKP